MWWRWRWSYRRTSRRKKRKREREKKTKKAKKSPQYPSRVFQRKKMEYPSRVFQLRGSRPQGHLVVTDGGGWWWMVVDGRKKGSPILLKLCTSIVPAKLFFYYLEVWRDNSLVGLKSTFSLKCLEFLLKFQNSPRVGCTFFRKV